MKCPQCSKYYCQVEILDAEPDICPDCIRANYEAGAAKHRASQIHYYKELITLDKANIGRVTIGDVEVECSGYYLSNELWDQEIKINGVEVYGILDIDVQGYIEEELIRRVVSGDIVRRCEEIEVELIDSDDPATLHLERSDLDGELEKLEEVIG